MSTIWTVRNLLISGASLSKVEQFQCSLALPNIKYDSAGLFWSQLYWLLVYALKHFLIGHHCEI